MPIVRTIELDKKCEACQAAGRALEMGRETLAKAMKKIREQAARIKELEAES